MHGVREAGARKGWDRPGGLVHYSLYAVILLELVNKFSTHHPERLCQSFIFDRFFFIYHRSQTLDIYLGESPGDSDVTI